MKVILDSNFLFIPSRFKLDIFEELNRLLNQKYDPVLLLPTYKELVKLFERESPKMRQHALVALKLAEKCRIAPVEQRPDEAHDDAIVRLAKEWKCLVATNDRELRKRLRHINVPVIYLRQKSRLEIEGLLT